ncbi:MAG: serine hydrolase domain-containing protein [Candidatus Promineifilaceae bacterium]
MNGLYWLLVLTLFLAGCSRILSNIPLVEGVEWISDSAENNNFNPEKLAEIPEFLQKEYPHVFSVVVQRNGERVYEYYADGQTPDSTPAIYSVTKSIASALVGIALHEGLIQSVDQTLAELAPQRIPDNADPNIPNITLKQLLTMTSGSYCRRDACAHNTIEQAMTRKWRNTPGTSFVYDTGVTQLISIVLEEATGMSVLAYAESRLFGPLAFENVTWQPNKDGVHGSGEGLFLRSRDMIKFGQLFLNEGVWEGERLLSADYIRESTVNQLGDAKANGEYGYLWWLGDVNGSAAHIATGYGGQFLTVVPDLDLVIAITSGGWRHHEGNEAVIYEFIAPAMND